MPPESRYRQERKARPEAEGQTHDPQRTHASTEGRVERWTAVIAGATEGFAETSQRYDLPEYAGEAVHEGKKLVRNTVHELRVTADGDVVLERRMDQAEQAARQAAVRLQDGARDLQETVAARKNAVLAASQRMREAPPELRRDARHAATEAKQAVKWTGIGIGGGAAFAIGGFLLLTAALAQAAMLWLGPVAGLWFATGAFIVVAAAIVAAGQSVARKHVREVRSTLQHMRNVAQGSVRPLRQAVSQNPPSHIQK